MSAHHSYTGWVEYQTTWKIYVCFIDGAAGPILGAGPPPGADTAKIDVWNPADALFINNSSMTAEVGGGWYYRQMTPNSIGIWKYTASIVADTIWVSGIFRCTYEGTAI